ncbi:MAG: heat-inducible transcription repressor HrcA [Elusimicrobia bacterium]|nr:heat-inducible transcription repressor HrcA [Elusimicrobiota bacterium]
MRVLDPQVAQDRKKQLLEWVIHHYIQTSKPIGSQMVAGDDEFNLSSATIRNILKELEEEGFLSQSHPSAGRIPTDKGYRFYVDYLVETQRLAAEERERIQKEYARRTEELTNILSQTSKMLSVLSRSAGFALSPKLQEDSVQRLELVPLGPHHLLAILVTQSGLVQHWPLRFSQEVPSERLHLLTDFLNEKIEGMRMKEIQHDFSSRISQAEKEFKDMAGLARRLLKEVLQYSESEELYVEGTSQLLSGGGFEDFEEFRSLLRIVDEKKKLARILEQQLQEHLQGTLLRGGAGGPSVVQVKIGTENMVPELRNLSLVTAPYGVHGKRVGLLGILGSKRMEYPKMMALVNFVSHVVSRTLESWGERGKSKKV